MLVSVAYNLADTFFVGQLNDPYQVAAVTITMPIFLFLMAFGSIFGIGGGAFISRLLGIKDYENAKKASSFAFYSAIITGIFYTGSFENIWGKRQYLRFC
jgi:Na+-driven multidrug efflux pump